MLVFSLFLLSSLGVIMDASLKGSILGKHQNQLKDIRAKVNKTRRLRVTTPKPTEAPPTYSKEEWKNMIRKVGQFLVVHKLYEIDRRYSTDDEDKEKTEEKPEEQEKLYMRQFPVPVLRSNQELVEWSCEKGFLFCVEQIYTEYKSSAMANKKLVDLGHFLKKVAGLSDDEQEALKPFKSHLQQFRYKVTALYYMCWFTLNEREELKHFGGSCHLPSGLSDYRSSDHIPYGCAMLHFCPDPCCGTYGGNGVIRREEYCFRFKENPCHDVGKGKCMLEPKKNRNFKDMIRNRLNITCDCTSVNKGFVWNDRLGFCVDEDECYDGTHACTENQICRNTPGGYTCSCRLGYYHSSKTKTCVRDLDVNIINDTVKFDTADVNVTTPGPSIMDQFDKYYSFVVNKILSFMGIFS